MAVFDKLLLSKYIASKYFSDYGRNITPIKLQKALYLLFAHYGGEVIASSNSELLSDKYLFDAKFLAWNYGPVEFSIYRDFKNNSFSYNLEINELEKALTESPIKNQAFEYISYLLPQIFEINDFKLVEITHLDESWKGKYRDNQDEFIDAQSLDNEEIISEYAKRKAKKDTA